MRFQDTKILLAIALIFPIIILIDCSQKTTAKSDQINKSSVEQANKPNKSSVIPEAIQYKYFNLLSHKPSCPVSIEEVPNYVTVDFSSDFPDNLKEIFKTNIDKLFPFTNGSLLSQKIPDYVDAGLKIICNYLPLCFYISFDKSTEKIEINLFLNYNVPNDFEDAHEILWHNFNTPVFLSLFSANWFILPTYVNLNALSYNQEVLNKTGGNRLISSTEYSITYRKQNDEYLTVFYYRDENYPQTPIRNEELVVSVTGYPPQKVFKPRGRTPLDPAQTIDGKLSNHGLIYKFFETDKIKKEYDYCNSVSRGDNAAVEHFLDDGCNPNSFLGMEYTPLFSAAANNKISIISLLLKHGADINKGSSSANISPLFMTASTDSLISCLDFLIKSGANINCEDTNGRSPLINAVYHQNLVAIEHLLASGADINHKTHLGKTAYIASLLRIKIKETENIGSIDTIDQQMISYLEKNILDTANKNGQIRMAMKFALKDSLFYDSLHVVKLSHTPDFGHTKNQTYFSHVFLEVFLWNQLERSMTGRLSESRFG